MEYKEDDLERLEYNEQQQCYHRSRIDETQPEGWQTICVAHPELIDKFRIAHPKLRGSFTNIRKAFTDFAGPFAMPDN